MEKLRKGQRIKHTGRPDWGLGQMMEDENANDIRVFFPNKGELHMASAARDKLQLVIGVEPPLNIPAKTTPKKPGVKHMPMITLDMAREGFLKKFPGGFYGKRLLDEERDYKEGLARVAQQLLAKDVLLTLIEAGNYQQVFENARVFIFYKKKKVENNLPSLFEKYAFRDGLKKLDDPKVFAHSLFEYLHGDGDLEPRFTRFAQVLAQMEADKWPIITTFRFFLFPATDVYIKPNNLQRAAKASRFETNYRPQLNWATYHFTMKFYQDLFDNLISTGISELKPRDMIDVQSFIWCIDPKSY